MASVLDADSLRFTFGDDWAAVKLDEHEFFKNKLMPLQFTGAVDIVGLYRGKILYLIEAKNYHGRPIELSNAEKEVHGDNLELKVARKVKDKHTPRGPKRATKRIALVKGEALARERP